jgi:hypothetical protein
VTNREFTSEEMIWIVIKDLRDKESITDLCQREGIHPMMYYKCSKGECFRYEIDFI